jgi:Domain of Unknown Function (DUF928)
MMKTTKKISLVLAGALSLSSISLFGIPNLGTNFAGLSVQSANAQMRGLYLAPIKKNPRNSQGSGSRGCDQSLLSQADAVKLVIPSTEYVAQTASGRPSFYYYVSAAIPVPMEFTLVKPGQVEPIMVKTMEAKQAGMVKVTIPDTVPELKVGETYKWSVSLICNSKRPSANPLFYSWVERVNPSSELKTELASADLYHQAKIYGQAGLWYDSLAAIDQANRNNPQDPSIQADFNALVQEAGVILR